ncbi:hypothetical protein [Spirosoma endophyticum]|uniref:Uncharacterized protein n=1 Tax=Spirosoma endophyticum TaxID=662367 RepID=A0A1I2FWH3_9BACT|nr:hypothetical protein [Spirosoma endophyticum]SFF09137.1 hypothetical protein SAMN05216167_12810 [Spirosoma endophyticum]
MTWQQKIISERYSGDAKRFEADFAEAVTEGNLHAVHWDDLIVDATTLPELKEAGRELIEINLGYLPPDNVMLPYEPYLRALIQAYWQSAIAGDEFLDQLEEHIKLIRNADMKHNTCLTYDEEIYQNFHKTYAPYGCAVRERLIRFLGYEPQLEHSLIAEMWLRDIMADDTYRFPDEITPDDIRAMTLVKYREILLQDGKEVADLSPLFPIR